MSIYISASSLSDFISCERKVYYRIFKPVEPIKNIESIVGIIVHKALELHWENPENANKFILEQCKLLNISEKTYEEIYNLVFSFYNYFCNLVDKNDLLEYRFKIKFQPDVFIVGKFDRISSGKVFDWKTGNKTPLDLSNNIQFIIYNYAYNKVFNSQPHGLYYASLRDQKLIMYRENTLLSDLLFREIIPDYINSILTKSFTRKGIFNGSCYICDWRKHCLENNLEE